jgi:hypothetical protein
MVWGRLGGAYCVRGIVCNLVLYLLMEKGRFKKDGEGYPIIILGPRKKAWISVDSFGRIETFQWVTTNPNKKIFSPSQAVRKDGPKCISVSFSRAYALAAIGFGPSVCLMV